MMMSVSAVGWPFNMTLMI